MEQKLNEKFLPKWDTSGKMFLAFDDCVPEDILAASKIRSENIRTGVTTINEERRLMRLPEIPNADEPMFQVQYAPLSAIIAGQTLKPAATPPKPAITIDEEKNMEQVVKGLVPLIVKKMKEKKNIGADC